MGYYSVFFSNLNGSHFFIEKVDKLNATNFTSYKVSIASKPDGNSFRAGNLGF